MNLSLKTVGETADYSNDLVNFSKYCLEALRETLSAIIWKYQLNDPDYVSPGSGYWNPAEAQVKELTRNLYEDLDGATLMPIIELQSYINGSQYEEITPTPDEDGDDYYFHPAHELRHTDGALAVRTLIHADTDRETAIRLLRKQAEWLEELSDQRFDGMKPHANTVIAIFNN